MFDLRKIIDIYLHAQFMCRFGPRLLTELDFLNFGSRQKCLENTGTEETKYDSLTYL